jgi:ribosomal protein S18 acetylase RimI-like enzyme
MIRPTVSGDTLILLALAEETGAFKPVEIQALKEVLDDYHSTMHKLGHRCVTDEHEGQIQAFAYYAPAAMTDRTWYLYWIGVTKRLQGHGLGGTLLRYVEDDIRKAHGRLMLIETSSQAHYAPTRMFYFKQGYEQAAVIADYYADRDDMVVFRKRLQSGR